MSIDKLMKSLIIILLSFIMIGCNKDKLNYTEESFEIDKATNIGKEYLKEYASDEGNNIVAYSIDGISESSDSVVLKYKVIKQDNNNLRVSIDNMNIKVIKDNREYSVSEVKSSQLDEVYESNNNLRYKNTEIGISEILVRSKDLPDSVYPQNSSINNTKVYVSNNQYNKLTININGDKVGVVTNTDKGKLITFMQVNNDKLTDAEITSPEGEDDNIDLQEIKEKPIATNVMPYDLIETDNIDKIAMTTEGDYLLIEYNNIINIYRIPEGEKIDVGLQELFPGEKYSMSIYLINDDGVFINVKNNDTDDIEVYRMDIKSNKIIKAK